MTPLTTLDIAKQIVDKCKWSKESFTNDLTFLTESIIILPRRHIKELQEYLRDRINDLSIKNQINDFNTFKTMIKK